MFGNNGGTRSRRANAPIVSSARPSNPDGPATPEQIEKARSTRERDEKRAAGHTRRTGSEEISEKADETKKPSSLLFTLIAATLALLVSIVWYFQRAKAAR
jgi:hypothetical protein